MRTPHTKFIVQGNIPEKYIILLKKDFGNNVQVKDDSDSVLVQDMEWYKQEQAQETPGDVLRFYRKLNKFTQQMLAEKLAISKQFVSNMEHNSKPISRKMANQFAEIFDIKASRFF